MILEQMAPALLSTWAACGAAIHGLCHSGLGRAVEGVRSAALSTLTALLRTCAELEATAATSAERKGLKAIASTLGGSLPQCLDVLERLVVGGDGAAARTQAALESLLAAVPPGGLVEVTDSASLSE